MRPLQLILQAFGPYADKEEIDFTKLGNRNMFVISGKTGAGKTTIFDGISFAIYGKASGEERNGPDLRSHFAHADLATEVSLKFKLRDKTYYIWRSPMQERKKKSGEGFTTSNAKAELYEISKDGKEILAANVRDVDEKIKEIIGLDATQFKQILMIPQGDFKKLLVSESKDKEVILQKLFHTQIYKRIEEKLKEEASTIKKEEELIQMEMNTLISSIEWNQEEDIKNESPQRIVELLEEELKQGREETEKLQNDYKLKEAWEKALQKEIFQGKELLAKFEEKNKLTLDKQRLEANKETIAAKKEELQAAEKASNLEKQEHSYLRVGKRLTETKEHVNSLKQGAVVLEQKKQQCQEEYTTEANKTTLREKAAAKVVSLQALQKDVLAFASVQKEVIDHEKQWKEKQTSRLSMEQQVEQTERLTKQIEERITGAQKATVLYGETSHEYEKFEGTLQLLKEFKHTHAEILQVEKACKEKKMELSAVEELFQQENKLLMGMEEALLQSHALILAAELQEGHPCSVCGSTSHPNPATHMQESGVSSPKEYEKQKNKCLKLDKQTQVLQQELYRLQVQLENLQTSIEKQEDVLQSKLSFFERDDFQTVLLQINLHLKNTSETLSQLQKQKEELPRLETQLQEIKNQTVLLHDNIKMIKGKEDDVKERYIQLNAKLAGMKERLPEEIRSEHAFEQSLNEAIKKRNELQRLLEEKQLALQQVLTEEAKLKSAIETNESSMKSLQIELDEERDRFKQEMNSQGFETYQSYKEAKKSETEMLQIQNSIEAFEKDFQRVDSLLTNLEYVLKGIEMPDIVSLEQQAQHLGEEMKEVRKKVTEMQLQIQQNEKIVSKLTSSIAKQEEVQLKYVTIGHLADMAKGQNPFRITFERYVLAAFLDDILLEANERLTKMTSGRYQLLRKVDPTRRNVQSGLELTVFDQYTGMERHVKTLSGGESFKASLSLALGLAAVVQQNAGGISLETMFIDEGFGTLDPESLDQAIEALLEIQSTGRLVGIISHVPELKERMDARLEVIGSQSGSTTRFVLS
ncbi:AAA family ATPase [Bacillus sp. JJ722]|uniref:AAA family ATPase n=1 Tax=Bacillus sp. JJ722 TaxID=3122973 RepID=UPI002FFE8B06